MAKPEWGTKRICPNCGTRYYDMRKNPPTCPSCSTVFDPEALLKSRRARPILADDTKKPVLDVGASDEVEDEEKEEALEEAEVDLEVDDLEGAETADAVPGEDDEDVLLEDAEELGDEDDMGEVVDVEGGDEDR
ncbi:TIGR02300 family protein [Nitrospirillum iridis]|uniref:Uncharacterized protein (TIGR02300 family) n=1 Tax=Nitrospirillum iridis TaxID=765888 RepID=A0A7X0B0E9_9PROT|nr:uncharacterized protein (TIGR02300 family) [Nitrospirillum iridis]